MRALLIYPIVPESYWSFSKTIEIMRSPGLLPPLGLLTVAAILPQDWEFRLIDYNVRPPKEED
ncbi:MAG: hypothetical protein ACPGOY_13320 [Rhodospirillaceae bacterium]